jgi:hypothetical protein
MKIKIAFLMLIMIPYAFSHTVTMNYAFNISDTKDNTIHINDTEYNASVSNLITFKNLNKKYISSHLSNSIFSIINAGQFTSASFNTTFSTNSYELSMTQDDENNRFLIGFTNATPSDVDNILSSVERFLIITRTIGNFIFPFSPTNFYMRLEVNDADISSRLKWSGFSTIKIRNNGIADSLHNITLEIK